MRILARSPLLARSSSREDAGSIVACLNGLLDISTRELVLIHRISSTELSDVTTSSPGTPLRKWGDSLWQPWPGDQGKCARLTLQQMMGQTLTPDTSLSQ